MTRLDRTKWAGLLDVSIDPKLAVPISRQIFLQLRQAVIDRALPAGSVMPSSRDLARRIGVSRTSVVSAYDELYAEGYIQGRHGSGTFVSDDLPEVPDRRTSVANADPTPVRQLSEAGTRYRTLSPADVVTAERPFSVGRCTVDVRTREAWRRLAQRALREIPSDALGYSDPYGRASFRQVVAEYLKVARAVHCSADQIMITSGAQQALDLCIKVLLNPGDRIWVEDPCYPATLRALVAANMHPVPVPVDADGMQVAIGLQREPAPRAIFLTPSHQCPTGAVMSMERRLELLSAAAAVNAWIIEDDYDSEFRYAGQPLSSLQGLDRDARVIYVGTLSKVLFPAARTGFLVLPQDLCAAFRGARYLTDRGPSDFYQTVVEDFIREGYFTSHVRRMRQHYQQLRDSVVADLREALGDLAVVRLPAGGMRVLVHLAQGLDDVEVAAEALRRNVVVRPLSRTYIEAPPEHGLDIGFTGFTQADMRSAAVRLGEALRHVAENTPGVVRTAQVLRLRTGSAT